MRSRLRGAAAGVSDRVREALHDLRQMTGDEMKDLRAAIERLANQVESLESRLESATGIRPAATAAHRQKRAGTATASHRAPSGEALGGREEAVAKAQRKKTARKSPAPKSVDRHDSQALGSKRSARSASARWAGVS